MELGYGGCDSEEVPTDYAGEGGGRGFRVGAGGGWDGVGASEGFDAGGAVVALGPLGWGGE